MNHLTRCENEKENENFVTNTNESHTHGNEAWKRVRVSLYTSSSSLENHHYTHNRAGLQWKFSSIRGKHSFLAVFMLYTRAQYSLTPALAIGGLTVCARTDCECAGKQKKTIYRCLAS